MRAGLARLRSLQHPSGGFAYWPGVWNTDPDHDWRSDWGTTYAGHFFLEAEKSGYNLPGDMKAAWLRYQKNAAQQWSPNRGDVPTRNTAATGSGTTRARYAQAYRLYTLALAGSARDRRDEPAAREQAPDARRALDARLRLPSSPASPTSRKRSVDTDSARRRSCSPTPIRTPSVRCCATARWCCMGMTLLGRDAETGAAARRCGRASRRAVTGTARSRWRSRSWRWRRTRARSRSRVSASTIRRARRARDGQGRVAARHRRSCRRRPRRAFRSR